MSVRASVHPVRMPLALLALAILTLPVPAQVAPDLDASGRPVSLPYLDARLDAAGRPGPALRAARNVHESPARQLARRAALARLADAVPGVAVQTDDAFGTPHFVRSTISLLSGPRGGDPAQAVSAFVADWPELFEAQVAELGAARLARRFVTRHNGVTHFTYQQQIDGVDLWGAELKANVTAQGELINISSTLLPRPEQGFDVPAAALDALGALRVAAEHVGIAWPEDPVPVTAPDGAAQRQEWGRTFGFRDGTPVSTELLFFPVTRDQIHPAWMVVVPEPGVGNTYEITVDAVDGTVLRRWNRLHYLTGEEGGTQDVTFNVWTSDSPAPGSPGNATPNGFQFPTVPRTSVTVTGASVAPFSPLGWISDGVNETLGNNVDAHTDLDADDAADLPRPAGSPFRTFDFPIDLAQAPSTYRDGSVAQLFYYCNVIHDKLYELGFDEAASNFQTDNFGLGGDGNDPVRAQSQDGLGTNNANWNGSGADGTDTRIQMYVFDGSTPDRDGSFDGDIVYHEYAHGLSIRLSGGTVFGAQSGSMGEGWSDFFGLAMNAEPGDDPEAEYPAGGYATLGFFGTTENYYWGIRRYPYSSDMTKSPLTFADIDPAQLVIPGGIPVNTLFSGNPADEVHNGGEIWCQALLECRAALWNGGLGFAANDLLMQLVVDGLKLMPSNPNMLEARDGILQADLVNNGGANLRELWEGFAKRGMGASATSPSGSTASGVVEAFDVPIFVTFDYPAGLPSQLQPSQSTTFQVDVAGLLGDLPLSGTGVLNYQVNGGPTQQVAMVETSPDSYEATLPAFDCFDQITYWVGVNTNQGPLTDPLTAPATSFDAEVFTSTVTVFADDMETDTGWTVGSVADDATTGIWERDDPLGTGAQPAFDNTADPAVTCWFTGQGTEGGGLGEADVDGGQTTLTTPAFDLSGGDARVRYFRWYSNNAGSTPETDIFEVDISNNGGGSWSSVEVVGPSGPDVGGGWIEHEFTVSDILAPTGNMLMRFIASDEGDGSLVEAALDDFEVVRVLCDATCQTDLGLAGPGSVSLQVCGAPLDTGNTAELTVTGAPSGGTVFLVFGLGNNPTPFKGGQLVPVPVLTSIGLAADASGTLQFSVPGGGGPFTFYLQAVVPDGGQVQGFALSNALEIQLGS